MIHFYDATTLALTKLRTRKVRLIITIVVSGLLFSGLAGASIVARGVMNGVSDFSKEGLGDRYIAEGFSEINYAFTSDKTVMERAAAIHKDLVARKKTEAKRLGITYDPASETSPVQEYSNPDGSKSGYLNTEHPAARQALQEYLAAHPQPDIAKFTEVSKPYKPKAIYSAKPFSLDPNGGQLQVLKDGQESFDLQAANGKGGGSSDPINSFIGSWSAMSSGLLKPFILPGQNLRISSDGSIPIIIPRGAAEQILKLKALPSSATAQDRLDRTKEIRTKAPDVTFSVCFRNSSSSSLVQQAVATKQEIEKNKSKKDYRKPDLIYGLPTEACGVAPITRDVRSKEQKTQDAKQQEFDQLFGTPAPVQGTLHFRIVGIVPDADYSSAFGVGQILRSLVTSTLGSGWYMPSDQIASNPLLTKLFTTKSIFGSADRYFAEFSSAASARSFIEKENCSVDYSKLGAATDPLSYCLAKNRPFSINPYGSNSLALETVKKNFGKFFRIAALAVSAIAAIIMMGTVGRMIADSRRETAVFRAIGAKRFDIAQIYIIYAVCLSLLISLFAIVVGLTLALVANGRWSEGITLQALTAYNAQDLDKTFSLYAFYPPDLLLLIGLSLAAGLLSAVFPLFRNLRRNPIRDMRDDT